MSKNIEVQYFRDKDAGVAIRAVITENKIFVSPYPIVSMEFPAHIAYRFPNCKLIVVRDWEDDYQDFPTAEVFLTPEDFLRLAYVEKGDSAKYLVIFFLEQALPKLTKQIKGRG